MKIQLSEKEIINILSRMDADEIHRKMREDSGQWDSIQSSDKDVVFILEYLPENDKNEQ